MLCLYHAGISKEAPTSINEASIASEVFLTVETAVKLFAYSERIHFGGGWNRVDFLLVLGSNLSLVRVMSRGGAAPGQDDLLEQILRALRVGRALKLLKMMKDLRVMLRTVVGVLPSIVNV